MKAEKRKRRAKVKVKKNRTKSLKRAPRVRALLRGEYEINEKGMK